MTCSLTWVGFTNQLPKESLADPTNQSATQSHSSLENLVLPWKLPLFR